MRRPSLRWMQLLPVLAVTFAGLILLAVYVERSLEADLIAGVDDELARAANSANQRLGVPPAGPGAAPLPIDSTAAPTELVLSPDGSVDRTVSGEDPFDDRQRRALVDRLGASTVEGDPDQRILVQPGRADTVVVTALPLDNVNTALAKVRQNLLVGGTTIFLMEGVLIWVIATVVARPVTRMTGAARSIAGGDLRTTIDRPTGSRETADLSVALERMVDTLRTHVEDSDLAAAEAAAARDDMRRFLADASHELRTPLTALKGYSDLHAGGMLRESSDVDRAMQRIGSESERLTSLVSNMLILARGESGSAAEFIHVDMGGVVAAVVDDVGAAHPEHHLTSVVDPGVESGDELVVLGNADQLHQALLNVVANSCQHTPAGTAVSVHVVADPASITVRVVDDGPGIDAAQIDDIFLPLWRGDASRSRAGHDGAGLGLAIARHLVELHQGTVRLCSDRGPGACFEISLPLQPSGRSPST